MSAAAHITAPPHRLEGNGEFAFTQADFDKIARILHRISGISLAPSKTALVYSRLAKRLRALRIGSFSQYLKLLSGETEEAERELGELLSALTTNYTKFFREPHHFEALSQLVRSKLAPAARRGASVRVWSAACSGGHEPYSAAMTILEAFPEALNHDVRILATDIDRAILARAQKGIYQPDELEPVGAERVARFTRPCDGGREVAPELRQLVSFRTLNLLDAWPMRKAYDVIFCRNVAIYFDEPTQDLLFERLAGALAPGGRLYIGHSERAAVEGLEPAGLTAYVKRGPNG